MKTIENFKLEVVLRILNAFKEEDEIASILSSQLSTYGISDEVIKVSTKHLISSGDKFGDGKKAKVLVKGAKVKRFKKGVDAVMDLKNGSVDAVVIDELTANEFVKKNAKKLKIVIDSAGSEYYCIALTKGNTAYKEEVNKQIKAIKEDGTYDKLKAKYIDSKN